METGIITGVLAISLALLNPSSNTYVNTASASAQEMRTYAVKEGDTLTSIAQNEYGSTEFWTTIWNDNDSITTPSLIEKNSVLKIRTAKQTEPEELEEKSASKTIIKPASRITPTLTQAVQTQTVVQAPTSGDNPLSEAQITFLGQCEAGMDPAKNTGNGYYGAFQFSYGTWKSMGTAYERADQAPIEIQKDAVQRLLKRSSIFTQFPGCARKMQALGML